MDVQPTPLKEMETHRNHLMLPPFLYSQEDFCSGVVPSLQSPLEQLGGRSPRRIICLKLTAVYILACTGLGLVMEEELIFRYFPLHFCLSFFFFNVLFIFFR